MGAVGGHEDARSPRGPEEGKECLDAGDSMCNCLAPCRARVPGELEGVPKGNLMLLHPFYTIAV